MTSAFAAKVGITVLNRTRIDTRPIQPAHIPDPKPIPMPTITGRRRPQPPDLTAYAEPTWADRMPIRLRTSA